MKNISLILCILLLLSCQENKNTVKEPSKSIEENVQTTAPHDAISNLIMVELNNYIREVGSFSNAEKKPTVYSVSFSISANGDSIVEFHADRFLPEIIDDNQDYILIGIFQYEDNVIAIYDYSESNLRQSNHYNSSLLSNNDYEKYTLNLEVGIYDDIAPYWIYKIDNGDSLLLLEITKDFRRKTSN